MGVCRWLLVVALGVSGCGEATDSPVGTWTAWGEQYDRYATVSQTQSVRDLEGPGLGGLWVVDTAGRQLVPFRRMCVSPFQEALTVSDSGCTAGRSSLRVMALPPDSLFVDWESGTPPTVSGGHVALVPATGAEPFVVTADSIVVDSAPFSFGLGAVRVAGRLVAARRTMQADVEARISRSAHAGFFRPWAVSFEPGGRFRELRSDDETEAVGTWTSTGAGTIEVRVEGETRPYRYAVDREAGRLTLIYDSDPCDDACQRQFEALLGVAPGTLRTVRGEATRQYRLGPETGGRLPRPPVPDYVI